jgi:alpha-mannosidase
MNLLDRIYSQVIKELNPLIIKGYISKEPIPFTDIRTDSFQEYHIDDSWGGLFDTAWFILKGIIPEFDNSKQLVLLVDIGGEGVVFDENMEVLTGITNKASSFGIPPDKPGKWIIELNDYYPKDEVTFYVDASCNDLFGYVRDGGRIKNAAIGVMDKELRDLYYDIEVIHDFLYMKEGISNLIILKDEESEVDKSIIKEFEQTYKEIENILEDINPSTISKAKEKLNNLYNNEDKTGLEIKATGHAHLDIAWLWPIREGRRKALRTFSNAIKNIRLYDDFIFGASQYQLFEWIKEDYPRFYNEIKKEVKNKRFELQGISWVESDLNIPSGESLIRQIYYGKKFLEDEFDIFVDYLWLPDVFGFTGSLPQILVKSGIKYMCSQKLSQNKINRFPYHSFKWSGIDGSTVLVHHFPENKYESSARLSSVYKVKSNYKEADIAPTALLVYGIGDGGGGPGEEHLERIKRIKKLKSVPKLSDSRVDDFLLELSKYKNQLPTINGELYFERHRGCYTTEVLNKQYNRDMEHLLRDYETLISLYNFDYNKDKLDKIWKEVLLYQFHDILPGSSIMRVYHNVREKYLNLIKELKEDLNQTILKIPTEYNQDYNTYINLSPKKLSKWIKHNQIWQYVEIPEYSQISLELQETSYRQYIGNEYNMENSFISVRLDDLGNLTSLYRKDCNMEYIDASRVKSNIVIYQDLAKDYPAWDFEDGYRDREPDYPNFINSKYEIDGPKQSIIINYEYKKSIIKLEYILYDKFEYLETKFTYDWHEVNKSVKVNYPITIESREALCNIQFGNIYRPTHSDDSIAFAKSEVPAHKFVDITDNEYGISLLSRNKYGFRVKEKSLEYTVLRSQRKNGQIVGLLDDPDNLENNHGDLVMHEYSMGLYPHNGNEYINQIIEQANNLNNDLYIISNSYTDKIHKSISTDKDNVVISQTIPSTKTEGIVLRIYESIGKATDFKIMSNYKGFKALKCNLMEEEISPINIKESIYIKPFEILTIILQKLQ